MAACDQDNGIERSTDGVVRVPLPENPPIACFQVWPGDTVVLPFEDSDDMNLRVTGAGGFLTIDDGTATYVLQGYMSAVEKDLNDVVVETADRKPIDIPVWLAITDPNLDITN